MNTVKIQKEISYHSVDLIDGIKMSGLMNDLAHDIANVRLYRIYDKLSDEDKENYIEPIILFFLPYNFNECEEIYDILYKIGFRHTLNININPTIDDLAINTNSANDNENTNE